MKKKKIINIRKSILTGTLILTTLLTGLTGCSANKVNDVSKSETPNASQTIISDGYVRDFTLPDGRVIISDVTPEEKEQKQEVEELKKSELETQEEIEVTPKEVVDIVEDTKLPYSETVEEKETPVLASSKASINSEKEKAVEEVKESVASKETTPTTPIVEESESIAEHTHRLGKWISINSLFEGNFCPDDGVLIKARFHNYKITGKKSNTNNDGTLSTIITATCQNCGKELNFTFKNVKNINNSKPSNPINNSGHSHGNNHGGGSSSTKPEHIHRYGEWVSINDELEASYCPDDGILVGTRAHKYDVNTKIISNNDGTHKIVTTETCINCNHSKKPVESENIACTFDKGVISEDKTTITYTCTECGYTKTEEYKEDHTHNWSEWVVTKEPTCTEDGEKTRICIEEGCTVKTETQVISKLGHNLTTTKIDPTCTTDGKETTTCSRCDYKDEKTIPALGHTYGEWIVIEDWHVVIKEDGTKVEVKTMQRECTICHTKETKTEERQYVPEHSHNWSEWVVTKEPTCTEDGERTRTCTEEGCPVKTETEVISKLGHNLSTTKIDPTCTTDGKETTTCSRCDYKDEKTIPALGHAMGEFVVTKEPTCTEKGEETSTCSRCDHTETRELAALGHKFTETTGLVSNNDGTHNIVKTKKCSTCNHTETEILSSGIECTYNDITEIKNADGEVIQEIHKCGCGDFYTVTIDPKPEHTTHVEDDHGQYERRPGDCCYETYYICKECGQEFGNTKVGHIEGEPDEFGVIQCTKCGKELGTKPTTPTPPAPPAPPVAAEAKIIETETIDKIISEQATGIEDANTSADEKLDDLINSDVDESEIDKAIDEIINEQEQEISAANDEADQKLNETIENIENAQVDQIITEQDQTIESAKENAESLLEQVLASDAAEADKDAAIDKIIEETDRIIGEAVAKADAKLSVLTGTVKENPMVRELIK